MTTVLFVTVPAIRPVDVPEMKPMEECVRERTEEDEGVITDPRNPGLVSLLPKDTYRTEQVEIDLGLIARIDDIGEYKEDGTFFTNRCRVWFRVPTLPSLDIEMSRTNLLALIGHVSRSVGQHMQRQQANQLVVGSEAIPGNMQNLKVQR